MLFKKKTRKQNILGGSTKEQMFAGKEIGSARHITAQREYGEPHSSQNQYLQKLREIAADTGWDVSEIRSRGKEFGCPESTIEKFIAETSTEEQITFLQHTQTRILEERDKRSALQIAEEERRKDWTLKEKILFKGPLRSQYKRNEWKTINKLLNLRTDEKGDTEFLFDRKKGIPPHPADYPTQEYNLITHILDFQQDPDNPERSKYSKYLARDLPSRTEYYYKQSKQPPYGNMIEEHLRHGKIVLGKGKSIYSGVTPIPISIADLYTHAVITGGTGRGKTTLEGQLALHLIASGANVFVFDPKGDLIYRNILPYLPEEVIKEDRVVIITPDDLNAGMAVSINLLNVPDRERLIKERKFNDLDLLQNKLKENFIDMIKRIWPTQYETPTLDKNLRGILGACLDVPNATAIDAFYIVKDTNKRWRLLNMTEKEENKYYLANQLAQCREEDLLSTENRLHPFFDSTFMKAMLCKRTNPLNFADFVKPGKVVLIDLSKSKLTATTSRVLGTVYLVQLWLSVMAKKGRSGPLGKRNGEADFPTFAVIDELQNFVTAELTDILSEARSYKFGMIMATQFVSQLDEKMRNSILENVGLAVALSVGAKDAAIMKDVFMCPEDALKKLNPFTFFAKAKVGPKITKYFYGELYKPCKYHRWWQTISEDIAKHSQSVYARPYDPADTSMFGADIRQSEDMLKAVYSLQLKNKGRTEFYFNEVKDEMERLSNLPRILGSERLIGISKTCESRGWLKVDYDAKKAEEKLLDKYAPFLYSLTHDGIEKIAPIKPGESAAAGGKKHEYLLKKARDFLLLKGSDLIILNQDEGGSQYLPDGEVHVTPTLDGRTPSQLEAIQKMLQNKYIYNITKGKDLSVEAESATLGVKEKIIRNFIKGLKQDRMVLFVVETEDDGYRLISIVDNFIEEGYKQYEINAKKGWDMHAIPRAPNYSDCCILVAEEPWRTYDRKYETFKIIKEEMPLAMDMATYERFKLILPTLKKMVEERKTDDPQSMAFETTISEIHSKTEEAGGGISQNDILTALRNIEGIETLPGERIENTIFTIPETVLKKVEATIEGEQEEEELRKKQMKEEYKQVLNTVRIINNQIGDKSEIIYLDEDDFCRKTHATKTILNRFIQYGGAERNGSEIYISPAHLAAVEKTYSGMLTELEQQAEEDRVKKEPITFYNLLSTFEQYIDAKRIDTAKYVPLDINEFYMSTGVKKQYMLTPEVEVPFRRLTEKHIKKINGKEYISRTIKTDMKEMLTGSKLLLSMTDFIECLKEKGILAMSGMAIIKEEVAENTNEYAETIWEILTKELKCQATDKNELFITNEEFMKLEANVHRYTEKHTDEPPPEIAEASPPEKEELEISKDLQVKPARVTGPPKEAPLDAKKEVAEQAEKLEKREEGAKKVKNEAAILPAKCNFCNKELQKQTECTLTKNYGYVCLVCYEQKVLSKKGSAAIEEEAKESEEEIKGKLGEQLISYLINTKKTKEGGSVDITCEEVFKALNIQNSEKKAMRELIYSNGMSMHNLGMPGYYHLKLADLKEKEEEEQREEKSVPQRILEYFEKHPEPQNIEEIGEALAIETEDIKKPLRRLVEKGELQNPKRGLYCLKDFKVSSESVI